MASLETVVKRNGQEVHFEKEKITNAILKAGQATNEFGIKRASLLAEIVCTKLLIALHEKKIDKLNIEFIQDMVEEVLFNTEYKKTAKAFAVYREQRHRAREITNAFHIDLVNKYVNKEDWKVKENANTTYSLQGLHHYMSSEISKQYWLNQIYPKEIREAHTEGDLYIHDLGHLSAYCCGWSLEDILLYGFTGVPGKVSSKPPKHFRTALGQLVNFLFSLSGEISGAVAVSNFDTLLAPFVKYDNLTYEEVKQAMQEFIFNSNIATRTGFQCVPDTYECLTPSGWKKYHELNIGDQIYVCDINTNKILLDNLQKVNVYDYEGQMFNFYNPLLSFITTPNHNTITSTSKETIDLIKKTSEELYQLKSGAIIPITNDEPNINVLFGMNITNITDWKGKVWCPTTATGTFICRNEYEVPFITGNSPFSNITLDLKIPSTHKDMPVIHDGKYHETDTYKDFQNESIMINKAFCEVMIEGDASGRIFTFPIPTYSVDKDFDWDDPNYDSIFAVSGKYGLQYWSNYINSDMSPEDARSMCPLHKDTDMIVRIKIDEDTIATVSDTIGNLYDNYKDHDIYVHYKASYKKASFLKVRAEKYITITFEDNFTETLEYRHIQPIIDIENLYNDNPKELFNKKDILAKDLTVGMKIPFSFGMKTIIAIKESVPTEEEYAYCFEVEEGEPYFELASGMVTHNCRLRLDNRELRRRGGGLFGASPLTGCYDDKTEIFTLNGWKLFKDLTLQDEVFTINKFGYIENHKPKQLFEYDWDGDLIKFKAKSLDLLVTPNHNMLIERKDTHKRALVEAQDFNHHSQYIPKYSFWNGEEQDYFILPAVAMDSEKYPEKKIPMTTWVRFLGIYLAEGSTRIVIKEKRTSYQVCIAQIKPEIRNKIKILLQNMPFSFKENESGFYIYNKQLAFYLKRFGYQHERFVPREILNLKSSYLNLLAQWLIFGDGHSRKEGNQICYWTTSKKLSENIQEIFLKLGGVSTVSEEDRLRTIFIKGREIISTKPCYCITYQTTNYYRLREHNISKEYYKGKVYCCEVTNHTVLVRRNGKTTWCGNSTNVVTINLPRLGYLAQNEEDFINKLDKQLDLAKEIHIIKRKTIDHFSDLNMYPYASFYLKAVKERHGSYWFNHFNTIGIIGMNEACLNLLNCTIGDMEGKEFALRVMDHIRTRLIEFQESTGLLLNLEATPSESSSFHLAKLDKAKFPNIKTAYDSDIPMYTNSTHLPVNFTDDIFELLELQDELQTKYTGGTVIHFFLQEEITDVKVIKNLIRKICTNYKLPYFSLTPTFSTCNSHGYIPGKHEECPTCGSETEIFSRIVGYYRPIKAWNEGKALEFEHRSSFKVE